MTLAAVWGPYRLWHLVLAVLVTLLLFALLFLLVAHLPARMPKKKPWVRAELREGAPNGFVPPPHWPKLNREDL